MSVQEPGICPMCGEELEYGLSVPDGECLTYECYCSACGFTGYEVYQATFIGHTAENDPKGKFIQ